MDISLDDPGFSNVIAVKVHDAPKSSSSSSASCGHPQCFYSRCLGRMSSFDRDSRFICTRCRGYECSVDLRCEECVIGLRRSYWRMRNIVNRLLQNLRAGIKFN